MSQLQAEPISEASKRELPNCAKLITLAQRELAAFLSAVVSLFGSEQATLAADAWVAELMSFENVAGFSSRDWRLVTVGALSRLADHLVNIRKVRTARFADVDTERSTDTIAR
jgi:hypothetical protein